ncbi:MAG: hypothetical protein KF741_10870 [Ferruginibacter sp.]|nr:hypothetical protein [Ferruginibacter sp.]
MSKDVQPAFAKNSTFEVFRYQLVVDKTMPINMFGKYETPEQLRAEKNNILKDILVKDNFRFSSSNSSIKSKLVYQSGDMYYFKISAKRTAHIYREDFTEDTIDNYPNIIVAINNNPDVQKIAIQSNSYAFKTNEIVRNFILESIDSKIKDFNLSFYVDPIYDKQDFWNFVRKHPREIKQLTFNLISPNLSNISKDLTINLREAYEDTNVHRTKLELEADKDSVLDIKEDSKFVTGIVNYSANGGGSIYARLTGSRKKYNTAENPAEFSIEDKLLKDNNWEELDKQFKDILI